MMGSESKAEDGLSLGAALAASEYPISMDAFLPNVYCGEKETNPLDLLATPCTIRHNSIHRYTLSTRTIAHYCRLEQVGEGTYGQVYRAKCITPTPAHPRGGEMVALKKIRLHHPGYWGIPPTVIREIAILKKLQHKNMVKMYEVVSSKGVEDLDWEDEWEDEKRKKEQLRGNHDSTPPALVNQENAEDSAKSEGGGRKRVALQSESSKKKKKDSMSDLEKLRESYKGNLFLVLEYISHDLTGLLDMAYKFTEIQIKSIIKQLLEVLDFMHSRNYVHRDLKSSNVLITDRFEVKLADYGLARCLESSYVGRLGSGGESFQKEGEYTNKVITLWYRPPELLLGETRYGTTVDIWSAGCILAEIVLGRPIFTGKTDIDQLKLIFDLLGTPTERSWEGFSELKLIRTGEVSIDRARRPKLREKYGSRIQPSTTLSLLEKLLELDPKKRFTASRALEHRYFASDPMAPDDPKDLGTIDLGGNGTGYHEFQTKKRRREAKAVAKTAEEEAKMRGEALEKQKEAFDKAYRDHLKKGANAEQKEDKMPRQPEGRPSHRRDPDRDQHYQRREDGRDAIFNVGRGSDRRAGVYSRAPRETGRRKVSRPDAERQLRDGMHGCGTLSGPNTRDRNDIQSASHGRYVYLRSNTEDGRRNEREFSRQEVGVPDNHLDQRGRSGRGEGPSLPPYVPPPGRLYDRYGNPIAEPPVSAPGGPDGDNTRQPQGGFGRHREIMGNALQGSGNSHEREPPRRVRGEWPSERGGSHGWSRNESQEKEYSRHKRR